MDKSHVHFFETVRSATNRDRWVNNVAPCLASRFFVRAWLGQLYRLGTSDCRYAINIATDDLKQLYPQRTSPHSPYKKSKSVISMEA